MGWNDAISKFLASTGSQERQFGHFVEDGRDQLERNWGRPDAWKIEHFPQIWLPEKGSIPVQSAEWVARANAAYFGKETNHENQQTEQLRQTPGQANRPIYSSED